MGNAKVHSCVDILLPVHIGEGGSAIDEIDGEVGKAIFLRQLNAFPGLPGRMGPVHPAQVLFKKRLYADTEPVDACTFPAQQFFPVDVIGIGLQGNFCGNIDIEMFPGGGNNAQQLLRFQQGRRAAPK